MSTCRMLTACGLLVLRTYFNQLFVSWDASNHPLTPLPAVRTWKKLFLLLYTPVNVRSVFFLSNLIHLAPDIATNAFECH